MPIKLGLFKQFIKHCLATGKLCSTFNFFLLYLERKQVGGFVGRPQADSICKDDLTVWPNSIDNIRFLCLCFSVCSSSFKWTCFSKAIYGSNSYWWFGINGGGNYSPQMHYMRSHLEDIINNNFWPTWGKYSSNMCNFKARYNSKDPMALPIFINKIDL